MQNGGKKTHIDNVFQISTFCLCIVSAGGICQNHHQRQVLPVSCISSPLPFSEKRLLATSLVCKDCSLRGWLVWGKGSLVETGCGGVGCGGVGWGSCQLQPSRVREDLSISCLSSLFLSDRATLSREPLIAVTIVILCVLPTGLAAAFWPARRHLCSDFFFCMTSAFTDDGLYV